MGDEKRTIKDILKRQQEMLEMDQVQIINGMRASKLKIAQILQDAPVLNNQDEEPVQIDSATSFADLFKRTCSVLEEIRALRKPNFGEDELRRFFKDEVPGEKDGQKIVRYCLANDKQQKEPAFAYYGDRFQLVQPSITDAAVLAMLIEAEKQFGGSFEIFGTDEFKAKCVDIAVQYGFVITNEELQGDIHKKAMQYKSEVSQDQEISAMKMGM